MAAILRKHGIERFHVYRYSEKFPKAKLFDLQQFKQFPQRIPIVFHEAGVLQSDGAALRERNSFFWKSPSYAACRDLDHLVAYLEDQSEENRICATMVLEDLPCWPYFDLERVYNDDPTAPAHVRKPITDEKEKAALMDAHWHFYNLAYEAEFKRSITVTPWEFDSSNAKKFSFHAHLPEQSPPFATVEDQRRLMHYRYFPMVQQAARNGDKRALLLGHFSTKEPKVCKSLFPQINGVYFHPIVDPGVYTRNRVFRLPRNRKPGREPLRFFRGPKPASEITFKEELQAALITCAATDNMLTVAEREVKQHLALSKPKASTDITIKHVTYPRPRCYRLYGELLDFTPTLEKCLIQALHEHKFYVKRWKVAADKTPMLQRTAYAIRACAEIYGCPFYCDQVAARGKCVSCYPPVKDTKKRHYNAPKPGVLPPCYFPTPIDEAKCNTLYVQCNYRGEQTQLFVYCGLSGVFDCHRRYLPLSPAIWQELFHARNCDPMSLTRDEIGNLFNVD